MAGELYGRTQVASYIDYDIMFSPTQLVAL